MYVHFPDELCLPTSAEEQRVLSKSREVPLSILIMRRFVGLYFNNSKILPTGFLMSALFIFRAKFRKS